MNTLNELAKSIATEIEEKRVNEGFSPVKGDCNISDYTLDWKEYLQMNDEDPEEYTLEEYAIDNGFVYYNK